MSLEVPRIFWPVVIDSTNCEILFDCKTDATGTQRTYSATIAKSNQLAYGTYTDPETLLSALVTAILGASRAGPVTFATDGGAATTSGTTATISTSGVVTITLGGLRNGSYGPPAATFTFTTPDLGTLLGYYLSPTVNTITGNAWAFTADYQMQHFWTPGYPVETDTGSGAVDFDTSYIATVSTNAAGQQVSTLWSGTPVYERTVTIGLLPKEKIWTLAESTSVNQALERLIVGGYGKFRYWPDRATLGTYADYFLREQAFADFKGIASTRFSSAVERYRITLAMGRYV